MKNSLPKNNFSFVAIGRMIAAILQTSFFIILANILDPAIYGEINFYIALAGTFSVISRFGLNLTIIVNQAKQNQLLSAQLNTFALITTGIAALILIPINEYAAILSFGLSMFLMYQHNLLGVKKYKTFMGTAILRGILSIIFAISFYFVYDIPGLLLGLALGNFIPSIKFWKFFTRNIEQFSNLKSHIKVILHNYSVDISNHLPRIIDKVLIAPIFGFGLVGIYQFNLQILFAMEILPITLHLFLLSEESSKKFHKKIEYLVIIISVIASFLIIITSPYVVEEFFPKYSEGILSLQVLSLSLTPITILSIFTAKLQSLESTKVGFAGLIRISSLLVLIIILGSYYELLGLSLAVLISASLTALFLFILYNKIK